MGHFVDFTTRHVTWFHSRPRAEPLDEPDTVLYRGTSKMTQAGTGISVAVLLFVVLVLGVSALVWQIPHL